MSQITPFQFGRNLAKIRVLNDLSPEQLADHLQISSKTLRRYETGQSDIPLSHIIKASDTLGASISDLFGLHYRQISNSFNPVIEGNENLISNSLGEHDNSTASLQKQIKQLESQLQDKEMIIQLLKEKLGQLESTKEHEA